MVSPWSLLLSCHECNFSLLGGLLPSFEELQSLPPRWRPIYRRIGGGGRDLLLLIGIPLPQRHSLSLIRRRKRQGKLPTIRRRTKSVHKSTFLRSQHLLVHIRSWRQEAEALTAGERGGERKILFLSSRREREREMRESLFPPSIAI